MKSIRKKFLAFLLIFLVLNDDLFIQVKASRELVEALRGTPLHEKTERRMKNHKNDTTEHHNKDHQKSLSTKIRRLKETKALSKSKTESKDFGITFLVLLGILIVAGVIKYYMDQKVKKAMEFLNNEKKKPLVQQYYQRIQEGSLNMNYCLTLQTLSKLSTSQELLAKVYEEDLREDLVQTSKSNAIKKLKATLTGYLDNRARSAFSTAMTDDCYNTYRFRQGWTQTAQTTTAEEDDGVENLDDAMAATDLSIKEFFQNEKTDKAKDSADWAFSADTMEIPGKYQEMTDPVKGATSEKEVISSPRDEDWDGPGATDFVEFFGTVIDNGKDFYEAYLLFKELKEGKKTSLIKKIMSVLKWIFTKTHNVLKLTGNIQKLTGAENSLNFPFLSLAASIASIAEKFLEYLEARKRNTVEPNNPDLKLRRDLAFYELVDELVDGVENIVTTILRFLVPLTLGLSEIINMSIKIFMKFIHIAVAFFKLRAINKMRDQIVQYYAAKVDQTKAAFEKFKEGLLTKQCSKTLALVKSFLDKEFKEIESKFENAKTAMSQQLDASTLTDDQVNSSVLKILAIVCETDAENCLGILRSKEFNLDLKTLETLDKSRNQRTFLKSYWISKGAKYGPINSAFLLTKKFNTNTDAFLQNYIPRSQDLLIQNGFYPIFQGPNTELWVCRICANPQYQLTAISHGNNFDSFRTFNQRNAIIQESVEGFSMTGSEITSYFVAEYEKKATSTSEADLSIYYTILPLGTDDNIEKLGLNKGSNYLNLQNHNNLAVCTTKSKKERSTKLLSELKKYFMPVLMTVVHQGRKKGDPADHQFITYLFSYFRDTVDYISQLNDLDETYCTNLTDELSDHRHNHFFLVVKKKIPTEVKGGVQWAVDPTDTNINEASLLSNGWVVYETARTKQKILNYEITYVETHKIRSDKDYNFDITIYMKEVIKQVADKKNPPNLRNTLTLLTSTDSNSKKLMISSLQTLYCDSCSITESQSPLEIEKGSLTIRFCDLNQANSQSQIDFQRYIRRKARVAAVSQRATIDDTGKANLCSALKDIKSYFGVTTADKRIDDASKCQQSLSNAITRKQAREDDDPTDNSKQKLAQLKSHTY